MSTSGLTEDRHRGPYGARPAVGVKRRRCYRDEREREGDRRHVVFAAQLGGGHVVVKNSATMLVFS